MEFFQPWHLILILIIFGLMAGAAYAVIRILIALSRKTDRS